MEIGLFFENLRIALKAIRTNLLRTILTILIIAFGIMALVGILTAIDSIKSSLTESFSLMGANTFTIESRSTRFHGGDRGRRINYEFISYRQAQEFRERFKLPATVSIHTTASGSAIVKYRSYKSNPNVTVVGADENYLLTAGYEIGKGRNFSIGDIATNQNVVIIGSEVERTAFAKNENPLNKFISVGSGRYRVIGVLESRGSSMGMGSDRVCFIPYTNVRQYFSRSQMSYSLNVRPDRSEMLDICSSEAEGIFRLVRNLSARDKNDFSITKSDALSQMLIENLRFVALAATIVGLITLMGAVIGLMNIMLVSVTERTREIGTRKAMGAKSVMIRRQFLYEAVVIGQLGGAVGILLGIIIGNIVSLSIGSRFIIPWAWIILGVVLCFIVGLVSGYFPAVKASKLDPIIALHYE
ncbi:MAG: ABC transporter permease [Bacteroidales bacterium]|nr:ABC transporter permease [Bacteroidales bacterium]MBN2697747.1 ABC transporter permease [Bacteroidales bacterium]